MLLYILLVAVIVVAVAMGFVILLQRSEGGALGMSGGGPGNFMSARGTGDLLTRSTEILAATFFALCLVMTLIGGHERAKSSIVNSQNVGNLTAPATAPAQRPQQQLPVGAPLPTMPAPAPTTAPPPAANPNDLFGQSQSAPKGK
jgi:preprotein translocase subunit SecG